MMTVNLIIGAGQLGSRHLQGLLRYPVPQKIFVLDPSWESLEAAKQRAQEIKHQHQIYFVNIWQNLPSQFDLVIIATNSDVREQVVFQLVENHKIGYLVLEKVLFQEADAYYRVGEILNKYQIPAWVNHPRRMFESYKEVKSLFSPHSQKVMQVVGGNWGLGCNALHYLDLFTYLTDSRLKTLETDLIDNELFSGKRKGFIEFTGTIRGTLIDNSTFQITSFKGEANPNTVTIFDSDTRVVIQESGTPQVICLKRASSFTSDLSPFKMEYQSSLTTKLAFELFEKGECSLPEYESASKTHQIFIREMLKKFNEISSVDHLNLPIT